MTSAPSIIMDQTHRRADVLVDPNWLEEHLDDPQVRLVEVDVSATAYNQGHIPGAVLWNVYSDLKHSEYRLLDAGAMEGLLVGAGIDSRSTVVCYGYAPARVLADEALPPRGCPRARLFSTSLDERREALDHRCSDSEPDDQIPAAAPNAGIRADYATVRAAIDGGSRCPKPGRVPGRAVLAVRSTRAVWSRRAHSLRHSPADRQRPRRTRPVPFRRRTPPAVRTDRRITVGDVITYCAIGGRAAIAWFMLTYVLGYPNVRVYDGSWAEWGHSGAAPVTTVACSPAS
jgi:thiosulfate/3-mercaptopyruvate sulfurtransferase